MIRRQATVAFLLLVALAVGLFIWLQRRPHGRLLEEPSEQPTSSKVTYALKANKLSKQQVMNFFKLWLVAIGPTNDE